VGALRFPPANCFRSLWNLEIGSAPPAGEMLSGEMVARDVGEGGESATRPCH
jgi:hypothetical protein